MSWNNFVYMRYDVYITHQWKLKETNPEGYERLEAVKKALKKEGLFIYDGEVSVNDMEMISFATVQANKCSRTVLVLVNEEYVEKTNNLNSHHGKEVRYTTTFPKRCVLGIIDETMTNDELWKKGKYLFGLKKDKDIEVVHFYNDEEMKKGIQVVVDHVNLHKAENKQEN